MEGLRERKSVLLGYSLHQRPLTDVNSPGSSKPFSNSDVDFHDVFGGPPRRFSMHEAVRPGLGVSDDDDDEDGDEKPVFGDDMVSRRKLPSADFFADIFGGGSSVNSTPMRHGREYAFPSSPGSRALSPLPPRSDPTFSTSSFASQFSLPGKSSESLEVPKFGSSSSNGIPHSLSSTSLSRFSSEPIRSSHLHQQNSQFAGDGEFSESNKSEGDSKKDSERTKNSTTSNNGQFHFSIYKWRSKGVPLDIPLRGKASRSQHVAQSQPANNKTPKVESDEFLREKQGPDVITDEPAKEFVPSKEETQKPELVKSVPSLFYDDTEKGMDASPSPAVVHTKTTKKQDRKNSFSNSSEANSNKVKGVQFAESNNTNNGRSKVKGKVKDFVQIFNHEPSPKAQQDGLSVFSRSKSCKWNEKRSFEEEEDKSINTPKVKEQRFQTNNNNPKASNNEDLKQSATVQASVQDRSTPGSDSVSDASNTQVTAEGTDDSFHDNFQVKDITQDENNSQLLESSDNQEFKDMDAKIRKWTRGKEGNIRSLLSTLQYVLWAESGWRTVPLVDIIEGSAVKRAYQRAMLCLHPDKLQQKNASSQQKYMAQKVFDILQEAWNYFNTLGTI